jgi:hypothetical protein
MQQNSGEDIPRQRVFQRRHSRKHELWRRPAAFCRTDETAAGPRKKRVALRYKKQVVIGTFYV